MVLTRQTYMKKYIGGINRRRTQAFKKNGINPSKYNIKSTPYMGIYKIVTKKPYKDITGYIVNGVIYSSRNIGDRTKKSKSQSWER